jgi:myo-inositol-1(or 4)-monophosphatase
MRIDLHQFTKTAIRTAKASGALLNQYLLGKEPNFQKWKGKNDLVTTADIESCRIIKRHLKRTFPDHSFLFEEAEFTEENGSEYLWIVDPLDGTTFHNRGLPFFSIIIALQIRDQTQLGLAYCPFTRDLFVSEKGKGSVHSNSRFRFHKSIKVSKTKNLDESLIGYSYGKSGPQMEQFAPLLARLLPTCRALVRIAGSDIGYLASGACDVFLDNSSTPWDFAAIALMMREAGGKVTDFAGKEWDLHSKSILASNGILHSKILEVINSDHR